MQGAIAQPVAAPKDVFPQFGGLEINTSSTALQALTDAVLYLVAYPYECSEQLCLAHSGGRRAARCADRLQGRRPAFAARNGSGGGSGTLPRLQGMQNDDGGFPYWRSGLESIPFNTIHVAHALYRAQVEGLRRPGGDAAARCWNTCAISKATTRPGTARRRARR